MKKYGIFFLALALICCAGCGKQEPAATEETLATTAPTQAPEETLPVPEVVSAVAEVDGVPAILSVCMRGDSVDVVDTYDEDHYVIKTQQGYGLVEKNLVREESAAPYEAWTGYAYANTLLYDNYYLTGEPVQTLTANTEVEVLENLGHCYLVKAGDVSGYIRVEGLSKTQISPKGGGAGGGNVGPSGGQTGGQDGGDISLQNPFGISLLAAIEQDGEVTGKATVLADKTAVVLGYFDRGEEIPVVAEEGFAEKWDGYKTVYLEGLYAYVPEQLIRTEGEAAYEPWDGYSGYNATVYDNFYRMGSPIDRLNTNTQLRILYELEDCYMVEVNGVTGFMVKEDVSAEKISTGGGSGGNGNSGAPSGGTAGGDTSGGGADGPVEWTPPIL